MNKIPKLSVNINKIATLRNSRGGNTPDVLQFARNCQQWGADGITVHPRPDERHIRYSDVRDIKPVITTEFNIEGNPKEEKFVQLVLEVMPTQVTLVPDTLGQLTSNHGWNTKEEQGYLREIVAVFKKKNIRVSIFVDPIDEMVQYAAEAGTDRIELYTELYASQFEKGFSEIINMYQSAAVLAQKLGLGVNAGHDLSLKNLNFFKKNIPGLEEVSIGHALVSDALFFGMENVIQMYKRQLEL